ncbi:DNA helicase [Frankia canadensis]|uniref:DNA 3'-5' helicase n=1 Tax=Frankia canadensis TaxID=1836972 RepID=A0A2I2KZ99_9ACTN|nr:ATP-dependent DNA helicase [Frankia canadensis]SNQ50991.1 DNA helicase [Frankia canadensis]SOU58281.1 DNA helicase [Frankia canadensis]
MEYTDGQRQAIGTLDDPLLIIACAGSGKTQVISQRIVAILRRPGVEPRNVVAFTFTDKAASELKDRTLTLIAEQLGDVHGLADMYIGTMHGFARAVLQDKVPATFKYSILDEIQGRLFTDRNYRKSGMATARAVVNGSSRPMKRYLDSRLYLQVMGILREEDVKVGEVPDSLDEALGMYRGLIHSHHYFDYPELLRTAVDMLESAPEDDMAGALVRHIRDTVRYVVVDEYQDTNHIQERIIRALCRFGANLCVVGDDDQTIYQWRGSTVDNIQTFTRRYKGVRSVNLDDNFRSSLAVVALAKSAVESLVSERLTKNMVAAGHQVFERGDLLALDFADPDAEAVWICDRITELRGSAFQDTADALARGLSWSDMAVLFRSVSKDADPLVAELKRRGIPYIIKGLARLFDAPEIQACVRCFEYIVDETDAAAVRAAWHAADLGLNEDALIAGLQILEAAKDWKPGERWNTYNIQRTYLNFLEAAGLREDTIPSAGDPVRGELVFYNLGKFSQAISDFEQIHFQSKPEEKYRAFAKWLQYHAPSYYEESDADVGYASPDAVTIATVHQAKGMQWPAVFIPALRKNRFPSKRQGGVGIFHVLPQSAVPDADRYRGTPEDEARLFYVALTRAQKYLALTYSPGGNKLYNTRSPFFDLATRNNKVLTAAVPYSGPRLTPRPRHELPDVTLSFSELKFLFECPYQFKLRFLYGFNPPLHEALGYGKSVHDVMAEIHKKAIDGTVVTDADVAELVDRHLSVPFAYPALKEDLRNAARKAVRRYLAENAEALPHTMYSEQQVQVRIAPGITVDGRIDLIRRLDTDEVSIVDFKSTERAQAEDVTRDQLHVYALGYQELTGTSADLVEVLNLDARARSTRELVNDQLLTDIKLKIKSGGDDLRSNNLPRHRTWCSACVTCDLATICRDRPST